MRWNRSIVLAAAMTLPFTFAACETEGEETGEAEIDIETEETPERPDVIIDEREPDVIIDERERPEDEGFDADVNVDEEGNVSGGVEVRDREP